MSFGKNKFSKNTRVVHDLLEDVRKLEKVKHNLTKEKKILQFMFYGSNLAWIVILAICLS